MKQVGAKGTRIPLLHERKNNGKVCVVLVSGLGDPGNSDWIPEVMENFVGATIEFQPGRGQFCPMANYTSSNTAAGFSTTSLIVARKVTASRPSTRR